MEAYREKVMQRMEEAYGDEEDGDILLWIMEIAIKKNLALYGKFLC